MIISEHCDCCLKISQERKYLFELEVSSFKYSNSTIRDIEKLSCCDECAHKLCVTISEEIKKIRETK